MSHQVQLSPAASHCPTAVLDPAGHAAEPPACRRRWPYSPGRTCAGYRPTLETWSARPSLTPRQRFPGEPGTSTTAGPVRSVLPRSRHCPLPGPIPAKREAAPGHRGQLVRAALRAEPSCWARIHDRGGHLRLLGAPSGLSGGDLVLVRESAGDLSSADPVLSEVDLRWLGVGLSGCELAEGTVRPGGGVMAQVLGQHLARVWLVDDQQPAGDLAAQGADDSSADGVRSGRLRRAGENRDAFRGEHGVEGPGELAGAIPDQNLTEAARCPRCIRRLRAACARPGERGGWRAR